MMRDTENNSVNIYNGEWKDNKKEGYGRKKYDVKRPTDLYFYIGEWKNDKEKTRIDIKIQKNLELLSKNGIFFINIDKSKILMTKSNKIYFTDFDNLYTYEEYVKDQISHFHSPTLINPDSLENRTYFIYQKMLDENIISLKPSSLIVTNAPFLCIKGVKRWINKKIKKYFRSKKRKLTESIKIDPEIKINSDISYLDSLLKNLIQYIIFDILFSKQKSIRSNIRLETNPNIIDNIKKMLYYNHSIYKKESFYEDRFQIHSEKEIKRIFPYIGNGMILNSNITIHIKKESFHLEKMNDRINYIQMIRKLNKTEFFPKLIDSFAIFDKRNEVLWVTIFDSPDATPYENKKWTSLVEKIEFDQEIMKTCQLLFNKGFYINSIREKYIQITKENKVIFDNFEKIEPIENINQTETKNKYFSQYSLQLAHHIIYEELVKKNKIIV
jgi:hypothetical protein